MAQENNYKVKSLSPAISSFQFQQVKSSSSKRDVTPLKIATTSEDYFSSKSSYQNSPVGTPTVSAVEAEEREIPKNGYLYRDQVIILDEETKQKLLQMGQMPLDAEWTFWYDK
jgi:hypothetical protein